MAKYGKNGGVNDFWATLDKDLIRTGRSNFGQHPIARCTLNW